MNKEKLIPVINLILYGCLGIAIFLTEAQNQSFQPITSSLLYMGGSGFILIYIILYAVGGFILISSIISSILLLVSYNGIVYKLAIFNWIFEILSLMLISWYIFTGSSLVISIWIISPIILAVIIYKIASIIYFISKPIKNKYL